MKKFKKINLFLIMTFIAYLVLGTVAIKVSTFTLYQYSLVIYGFGATALISYIFGVTRKYIKRDKIDTIILSLIMFGLISVYFAYDMEMAIMGYRQEGMLMLATYYFMFLIAKQIVEKEKIIYTILIFGLIQVIYAVIQWLGISPLESGNTWYYSGFLIHSNFFSTFMVICCSLSIGTFTYKDKNILNWILVIIYTFGIVLANAMSGFVGLCIVLFLILFSKKVKKILIIYATIAITFLIGFFFVDDQFFKDIGQTIGEIFGIVSTGEVNNEVGNNRGEIWNQVIDRVDEHWLNGIGVSNMGYLIEGKPIYIEEYKFVYYEAHNELLHTLITQGIFAFIAYIVLYTIIIIRNIKNENKIDKIIFLAVISYIVQAMFNISVVTVAPFFFILMGMISDGKIYEISERKE